MTIIKIIPIEFEPPQDLANKNLNSLIDEIAVDLKSKLSDLLKKEFKQFSVVVTLAGELKEKSDDNNNI